MVRVEAWLPTPDPWRTTLRQGCCWTATPGMAGWAADLCDGSLCSVNQEGVGPPSTHRPGVLSSRAPQSPDNQTGWAYTAAQTEQALAEEQVGSPNLYSFLFSLHTRFLQAYILIFYKHKNSGKVNISFLFTEAEELIKLLPLSSDFGIYAQCFFFGFWTLTQIDFFAKLAHFASTKFWS